MTLEQKINEISEIRLEMWPESANFNILEFDHLIATLFEEAIEFRQAARSYLGRPFNPEKTDTKEHMVEELGDILVPVIAMANQTEISLHAALNCAKRKLLGRLEKNKEEERIKHIMMTDAKYAPPYDATKTYQPGMDNAPTYNHQMKFRAEDHQPIKYDLDDPINVQHN
jgi:NTP pyrophosphatase (non-canonical NTP hydrolase)